MARLITVQKGSQANAEPIFEQPLGSESSIREFWSNPARELGLPLLTPLYETGFYNGVMWKGKQLSEALGELTRLELYWATMSLDEETRNDLQQRAAWLREALRLAELTGASVDIG